MKRSSLVQLISLPETTSTVVLPANVVVESSRVFHPVDSTVLQAAHRRTPAAYGMLSALPTMHSLLLSLVLVLSFGMRQPPRQSLRIGSYDEQRCHWRKEDAQTTAHIIYFFLTETLLLLY